MEEGKKGFELTRALYKEFKSMSHTLLLLDVPCKDL